MSVQINMEVLGGMPSSPQSYVTTQYANPAAAVAAIVSGFLPVTLALSPNTTAGGPPSPETLYVNSSRIATIVQL